MFNCPKCGVRAVYHGHELGEHGCDTWCLRCNFWFNEPTLEVAHEARAAVVDALRKTPKIRWRKRRRLQQQLTDVAAAIESLINTR